MPEKEEIKFPVEAFGVEESARIADIADQLAEVLITVDSLDEEAFLDPPLIGENADPQRNQLDIEILRKATDDVRAIISELQGEIDDMRSVLEDYVVKIPDGDGDDTTSVTFSGTAYVSGNEVTGLNSDGDKPYVMVDLDLATATEQVGPPPNPFPPNQEWYEKATTYGDIHAIRA